MDKIQSLIQRHEDFKKIGLQLNEENLFDWICLWEEMLDECTRLKSGLFEEKQQLEVEKGLRRISLKSEIDDKGKKIHTESTCDANINQEFYEKDQLLSSMKLKIELLQNKSGLCGEYINIVKMFIKK